MKTNKCTNCSLVNFSTNNTCKRCNTPLNISNSTQNIEYEESSSAHWTNQVITRNQEIIIGLVTSLIGVFIIVMNWMNAIYSEEFYSSMTFIGPVCVAMGMCFLIFPFPEKEHFPKAEYAPKTWAIFLIPSFILGAVNWAYFMGII